MEIKKQTNLRGELTVPGDKSISHRAVILQKELLVSHISWKVLTVCRQLHAFAKWVLVSNEMLLRF